MDFKPKIKINKRFRLSFGKPIVFFVPMIGLLFIPTVTHAGVFSDLKEVVVSTVTGLWRSEEASAQSETIIEATSQTMVLLEPATNIDPRVKISGEVVMEGGEALIPEVGPSNQAPDIIDNFNGQISVYTVRSGDTLAKVADMFGVSVNTIVWANDLNKNTALKAGQSLVILPISGIMHTVVSGDTLSSIAKKYGGDLGEISSFNDLAVTDKLAIGMEIMIPDGEAPVSAKIVSKTTSTKLSSTGATKLLTGTANGPYLAGYFAQPFPDGPRIYQTQGLHGYNSVDYGMPVGTPLYAAAPGTVIISKNSGWNGGYGNYVVIQHPNGTQTVYGHMNKTIVSVGQLVTRGQSIGYSGNSGNSTGPHLHLEVRGAKNPFNHM